jgi:putative colanic acid biosynthesis acetyltransferase WcaF
MKTAIDLSRFEQGAFDRGAGRAREACWLLLHAVFFNCPVRLYGLRARLLRAFGATVGVGSVIKPRVSVTLPWRLKLGDHVWLGEEAWLLALAPITIGSHVCISQRAFLCTGNHDWSDPAFSLTAAPITIGNGAWICASTFIGPGVHVGENSVVTAGSVVVRDLPSGMICSGNPCEPVKPRPPHDAPDGKQP